ncbi:hypothetical protein ACS0TY_030985 [Phlomoides rotata]
MYKNCINVQEYVKILTRFNELKAASSMSHIIIILLTHIFKNCTDIPNKGTQRPHGMKRRSISIFP